MDMNPSSIKETTLAEFRSLLELISDPAHILQVIEALSAQLKSIEAATAASVEAKLVAEDAQKNAEETISRAEAMIGRAKQMDDSNRDTIAMISKRDSTGKAEAEARMKEIHEANEALKAKSARLENEHAAVSAKIAAMEVKISEREAALVTREAVAEAKLKSANDMRADYEGKLTKLKAVVA